MIMTQSRPVAKTSPIDRAVNALRAELAALNYNLEVRRQIVEHAFRNQSLAGLAEQGLIDAEDLDRLTEAFVAGFGVVPMESKAWDRFPGRWITADDILPAVLPIGNTSSVSDMFPPGGKIPVSPIGDKSADANMSPIGDKIPVADMSAKPPALPIGNKPADLKPIRITEARLDAPPSPADSVAHARMVGTFDLRRKPTVEDWREYQRFTEWRDQSYVVPDVSEQEAAEIGRPFSRCC